MFCCSVAIAKTLDRLFPCILASCFFFFLVSSFLPFQYSSLSGCPYKWALAIPLTDMFFSFWPSFFSWFYIYFFLCPTTTPPFSVIKLIKVSLWVGTSYKPWHTECWTRLSLYDSPLSRVFMAHLTDTLLSLWPSVCFFLVFYFLLFLLCPSTPHLPFQFSSIFVWPYEWALVITPDRQFPYLLAFCSFFSWFSILFFFCCVQRPHLPFQFSSLTRCPYEWALAINPDSLFNLLQSFWDSWTMNK